MSRFVDTHGRSALFSTETEEMWMELGRKKGGEIEREEGGETAVAMKNK